MAAARTRNGRWVLAAAAVVCIPLGAWISSRAGQSPPRRLAAGGGPTSVEDTEARPGLGAAAVTDPQPRSASTGRDPPGLAPRETDARRTAEIRRVLEAIMDAGIGALWGDAQTPELPSATAEAMPAPELGLANQADAGLGQYIAGRIHSDFAPLASSCFENALSTTPTLHGHATIRFTIVGDRRVGAVVDSSQLDESSEIHDPAFEQCLKESMMTVNFAAPPDGTKQISSAFTLLFDPNGDGG